MSACSQCGTVVKATDKFCNVCGAPIVRSSSSAPPAASPFQATAYAPGQGPAQGYGPAPQQQGAPPPRCQYGHEIAPGASYCPQGHPIALDQMQLANDPYGGGYGQPQAGPPGQPPYPVPGQRPSYGAPPPSPYGAPPQGGPPAGYTPPPPQAAYASAFGAPAQPQAYKPPGYGPPAGQGYAPAPPPAPYAFAAEPPREPPPKVLRGFLVAYGTNPSGEFWPLTAGRLIVGRFGTGDGLDIPLQDPTISSRHAAFVVDGGTGVVTIEDTGSTNGTFVNDEHIGYGGRRELKDGDRLRFGGFTTVVKVVGRV